MNVAISFGEQSHCGLRLTPSNVSSSELRDDVEFDTMDLLADPAVLEKHVELQYVL